MVCRGLVCDGVILVGLSSQKVSYDSLAKPFLWGSNETASIEDISWIVCRVV